MPSYEFAHHLIDALDPILRPSVIPITALNLNPERMRQHGTGTLLSLADKQFLITAWHVLRDALKHKVPLFISDLSATCGAIPLEDLHIIHYDRPVVDGVPIIDVCILELTESIVSGIPNRRFLNLSHVDLSGETKAGKYYIYGFPCETVEPDDNAKTIKYEDAFKYLTIPYDGDTDTLLGYDSRFHLLLHCPFEGSVTLGSAREPRPRDLIGISGCSLWRVFDEGANPEEWKPEHVRIVGVQSSQYKNKIAKGIRWRTVVAILWMKYPDLRQPIRVSHPDVTDDLDVLAGQLAELLET